MENIQSQDIQSQQALQQALQQEKDLQAQELQLPTKAFEGPEPSPSPDHPELMTETAWSENFKKSMWYGDLKRTIDVLLFVAVVELFIIIALAVEITENGNVVKKPVQTNTISHPTQAGHHQGATSATNHAQQNVLRVPHNSRTNPGSTGSGVR